VAHEWRAAIVVLAAATLFGTACRADDEPDAAPDDASIGAPAGASSYEAVVYALAADEMQGRDNQTEGSALAQDFLIEQLTEFAQPLADGATGDAAFRRDFAAGTNILGLIPGGERADEYVILGAHYDHLGRECRPDDRDDTLCNGAADNAAGVAAVLEVGRALAADDDPPARSVILAFWDAEEDGLLGSKAYVDDPEVPLERTTAYLNWDIQGANLAPSLAGMTVMVGAETGGPNLVQAANDATSASSLRTLPLSLLFGQGRSDHVSFVDAGVPTVFFTDATAACYHTPQDDVSVVDFDKLGQQIATAQALTRELANADSVPSFVGGAATATYEDAVSLLEIVRQGQEDLRLLPGYETSVTRFLVDLEDMVDAGSEAFGDDAIGTLLGGAVVLVEALTTGDCDGFLR